MIIHFSHRSALCGALLLGMILLTRAESYYVKDLGTLGGSSSQAYALNKFGQVVGYAATSNNAAYHAVLFSGSGFNNIDLGNLGGSFNNSSEARGINDSGQIVGWAMAPSGYFRAASFSGTGSNNVDLGNLCSSGTESAYGSDSQAINNSGTIVGGGYSCAYGGNDPARYSGAGSDNIDLGSIGAGGVNGEAYDINASGQIAGQGNLRFTGAQHAALFSGSGSNNVDLGTAGGFNSSAYGINDAGQIVGDSDIPGNSAFHAVLFSGTGSNNIDLGTLGGSTSHAYAINNPGEIVGNSYPATNNNSIYHAFIYRNGVMSDINGLVLSGSGFSNIRLIETGGRVPGRAINDSGQIAAVGEIGGQTHAILLTPVLRKIGVALGDHDVVVTFDAIAGKTYRLEWTLDLANPNWQSVPGVSDVTAMNNGQGQFIQANGAAYGAAYYRVQLL